MVLVKILLVLFVHLEQIGENHCEAGAHLEILGIHRNLDASGNIQIVNFVKLLLLVIVIDFVDDSLRLVPRCIQAFLQSRKSHTDDHGVLALCDDRAVVYLDILCRVVGKSHPRHSRKRHVHIFVFHMIGVVDVDLYLTAFSGQLIGGNLPAVQVIGDLLGNRDLTGRLALIIDIVSIRVPDDAAVFLSVKSLVALHILNILQDRVVIEFFLSFRVLEPVRYCDIPLGSVRIRENIDCLFLAGAGRHIFYSLPDRLLKHRCIGVIPVLICRQDSSALLCSPLQGRQGCRPLRCQRSDRSRVSARRQGNRQHECQKLFSLHFLRNLFFPVSCYFPVSRELPMSSEMLSSEMTLTAVRIFSRIPGTSSVI